MVVPGKSSVALATLMVLLGHAGAAPVAAPAPVTAPVKVLLLVEENHTYDQIIGSAKAPYLNQLATAYGSATGMDAGYPTGCPSLATVEDLLRLPRRGCAAAAPSMRAAFHL